MVETHKALSLWFGVSHHFSRKYELVLHHHDNPYTGNAASIYVYVGGKQSRQIAYTKTGDEWKARYRGLSEMDKEALNYGRRIYSKLRLLDMEIRAELYDE